VASRWKHLRYVRLSSILRKNPSEIQENSKFLGCPYCYKQRSTITELLPNKYLTVLAIQTPTAFSAEQFFEILSRLQNSYSVESMQTAFAAVIPDFGQEYRNDLHLTAHLRAERVD
jgi:hypothetical protein